MFGPISIGDGPLVSARLLHVLGGALRAVDARRKVAEWVDVSAHPLLRPGAEGGLGRVIVLGMGKAALGMAWGLADAWPDADLSGIVATPQPGAAPPGITVHRGAHPVPDESSVRAGRALLDAADAARAGDLVIVLLSGGGSACAEVPSPGLRIDDIARCTAELLRSGATIGETNTVRRSLSAIKGGGLAAAIAPAPMVALVMSDVVGNDLATIAGGPTVADPTGPADAIAVLEERGLHGTIDPGLILASAGARAPGPPAEGPVVVIADAATAADGARRAAEEIGIRATVVDVTVTGEAREIGAVVASSTLAGPAGMSIYAGETTVTVRGAGSGGRNQELALAAALELEGSAGVVVASLGTDGVDGPTDAAGGAADGRTVERGRSLGMSAASALDANDSGTYLGAVKGRLVTGPTGTNVGDVMVGWRL